MTDVTFFESLPISTTLNSIFKKDHQLSKASRANSLGLTESSEAKLRQVLNRPPRDYPKTIGAHPDFADLKLGEDTDGQVTSLFVDIKSSTKLGFDHDTRTVRKIKQSLIESAIIVFQAFDGHIHRLQGDAVVAFFRRSDLSAHDTTLDSVNAATTLLALLKSYINPRFVAHGLDPISIRIGIDHDPQALWSHYGIRNVSEITATGRYVDLAAKLQSRAGENTVMVGGDNLKTLMDFPDEFVSIKTKTKDGEIIKDRYIYRHEEENYSY